MAMKQFKYSIVMSVYNVEPYIEEAVQSVLSQSIGFSENIQIIFVNDGSSDNGGEICKKYCSLYPENMVYIEQENKGLAAARNVGIESASGSYINFFDPDDILSPNAIEEVDRFFSLHGREIDFVTIPLVYFEGQKGLHGKYGMMGKRNRVIDLLEQPACFILSSAGSFYKTEIFKTHRYDEELGNCEDAKFNMALMKSRPRFGYVCENGVKYHYRRRATGGSNTDKQRESVTSKPFRDNVLLLDNLFADKEELLEYEQEFAVYLLRSALKDAKKGTFDSSYSFDDFLSDCRRVVSKLDTGFILDRSVFANSSVRKQLFLTLKGVPFSRLAEEGSLKMSLFDIRLKDIEIAYDVIRLDLLFNTFDCPYEIVAVDENGKIYEASSKNDLASPFDISYGEFELDVTHHRIFELPFEIGTYSFLVRDKSNGQLTAPLMVRASGKPPMMSLGSDLGVSRFGKKAFIKENRIEIVEDAGSSFLRGCQTAKKIKDHSKKVALLRPFSRMEKKYVIISDRPKKAGDNGQALYEHIMRHGSRSLKRKTYFVLDKESENYSSLCCKSHVLQPRSLRHKLKFLNAQVVYSSHNAREFYMPFAHKGKYYADLLDYRFVWLQHGITQNNIARAANRLATEDDFIIAATKKEQEALQGDSYFYRPEQIVLAGFSRYDKLKSNTKKLITIAPTWRGDLSGKILRDGTHAPRPGFEQSEYYRTLMGLLVSERFKGLLGSFGYRCQFLCHPAFTCYEPLFAKAESECVSVLPQSEASYSEIFSESAVFVTDFSSTAFDFAYLGKPLICFQFDELTQCEPGWFSYEEDGLGPVKKTVDEVVDYVELLLKRICQIEDIYAERIDKFFEYRDQSNCKRILDATLPEGLK